MVSVRGVRLVARSQSTALCSLREMWRRSAPTRGGESKREKQEESLGQLAFFKADYLDHRIARITKL
jgi:hypothetical protein